MTFSTCLGTTLKSGIMRRVAVTALIALGCSFVPVAAQDRVASDVGTADKAVLDKVFPAKPSYSPYAGRNFPTRPLFGDTHLHTAYSMDAGAFGARLGPTEAYRLARGEEVVSSSGQPVKLSRPLDFLVVADHSDGFGFFPQLMSGDPELLATEQGKRWYDQIRSGHGAEAAIDIITSFGLNKLPKGFPVPGTRAYRSAWQEIIKAADDFNDPGHFTAFIGFEWTSNSAGNNLHRNILFREDGNKASLVEPYTTLPPFGSSNPEDLWKWMAAAEEKTGSEVLAIAHNGNLSNGLMFPVVEAFGKKLDQELCRDARQMGAPLRDHPDQGHRRSPSLPVAQRRIRQLRDLGQGQPRWQRGQEKGHARSSSTRARR